MKKLNKIEINSESTLNNKELLLLKGGYDGCSCTCTDGYHMAATSESDCKSSCQAYGQDGVWRC